MVHLKILYIKTSYRFYMIQEIDVEKYLIIHEISFN